MRRRFESNIIMAKQRKNRDKGSALVLAVFAALILTVTGVGLLSLGVRGRVAAIRDCQQIEARCAADAGLVKAVYEMNDRLKTPPWSDFSLPDETGQSLTNCNATYSYAVSGDILSGHLVTSTGTSDPVFKRVLATVRARGLFENAILTQEILILKAGMIIDSYNSGDLSDTEFDTKIATTSIDSDQIILNNGVVVVGKIFVGVDGSVEIVIKDLGATTGYQGSLTEEILFPVVTPPSFSGPDSDIQVKGSTLTIGPADNGRYGEIELTRKKTGGVLEISGGDVVLHVTEEIDMGQDCEIIIAPGSSLTLFLDGDLSAGNNSGFNNQTQIPGNFRFYGTADDEQDFDIRAKSDAFGAIYAPNADITIMAGGDVYGAVVAKSFEMKSSGTFHYDEALSEVNPDDFGVKFVVESWNEE
jgi:hypothetical protein